ncbi:hypothetical protein [Kitasatospora sp. NPDC001683]
MARAEAGKDENCHGQQHSSTLFRFAHFRILASFPGGRLLMELSTLEQAMHEIRTTENEEISTKQVRHGDLQEESWFGWNSQLAHVRYSRPGWSRGCRTRMYSRSQLRSALLTAGFNDVRMMGDLRGGPVDDDHRTVTVATS